MWVRPRSTRYIQCVRWHWRARTRCGFYGHPTVRFADGIRLARSLLPAAPCVYAARNVDEGLICEPVLRDEYIASCNPDPVTAQRVNCCPTHSMPVIQHTSPNFYVIVNGIRRRTLTSAQRTVCVAKLPLLHPTIRTRMSCVCSVCVCMNVCLFKLALNYACAALYLRIGAPVDHHYNAAERTYDACFMAVIYTPTTQPHSHTVLIQKPNVTGHRTDPQNNQQFAVAMWTIDSAFIAEPRI